LPDPVWAYNREPSAEYQTFAMAPVTGPARRESTADAPMGRQSVWAEAPKTPANARTTQRAEALPVPL